MKLCAVQAGVSCCLVLGALSWPHCLRLFSALTGELGSAGAPQHLFFLQMSFQQIHASDLQKPAPLDLFHCILTAVPPGCHPHSEGPSCRNRHTVLSISDLTPPRHCHSASFQIPATSDFAQATLCGLGGQQARGHVPGTLDSAEGRRQPRVRSNLT